MLRPLEISLRVLEPGELDDWLALLNSASQGCPGFEPLVPLDYRRLQARGYADPCSPLVAVHGTELYGGVTFAAGRSSQRGRLNDLCVRPEVRRHGLGRALVTAALAELRERGIQHVQAQGWPVAAYDALYRSVGLVPARRYRLLAAPATGWRPMAMTRPRKVSRPR